MKTTHIGPKLWDGRRPVSIYRGPEKGWMPSGYLMPEFKDTRQQPKSLAQRLTEARNNERRQTCVS